MASGDIGAAKRNADISSNEIFNEIHNLNTLQKKREGSFFHAKLQKAARSNTRRQEYTVTLLISPFSIYFPMKNRINNQMQTIY